MHHTKGKADVGVAKTIADLTVKGHVPCLPLSEHQPYDLVVVLKSGRAIKVQVKFASLKKNGTIDVRFRSSWSDRNGTHVRHYGKDSFDYYAIYCPEKDTVLYVPNTEDCPKALRFSSPRNNQSRLVKWAHDFADLRESSETICRTPEMVKT